MHSICCIVFYKIWIYHLISFHLELPSWKACSGPFIETSGLFTSSHWLSSCLYPEEAESNPNPQVLFEWEKLDIVLSPSMSRFLKWSISSCFIFMISPTNYWSRPAFPNSTWPRNQSYFFSFQCQKLSRPFKDAEWYRGKRIKSRCVEEGRMARSGVVGKRMDKKGIDLNEMNWLVLPWRRRLHIVPNRR